MSYKPQWATSRLDVCLSEALLGRSEYRCLRTELLRALAKARAIRELRAISSRWGRLSKNQVLLLLIMYEYLGLEGDPLILP